MEIALILLILAVAVVSCLFLAYYMRTRDALSDSRQAIESMKDATKKADEARERTREALREAEASAAAKTNFIATMSHEIRTPINAIVGFSEFLSDPDVPREKLGEYAHAISLSAHALLSLINDVLDIAKFESGRHDGLDIRTGETNMADLFDEMDSVYGLRAREKGLSIDFSISKNFPRLRLFNARVRQILMNLIGNAVKFTSAGGVSVSASYADRKFTLTVKDTGIGISKRALKTIFDPFSQDLDNRRGKVYSGTGLGLSIVKRLVDSSGGRIEVESLVDRGSTFKVEIPDVETVATAKEAAKTDGKRKAGEAVSSVVIVDDVPLNSKILGMYCMASGISNVAQFSSAAEVLAHLENGAHPDVILSDLWMPGMNGDVMARRVNEKWPDIPVVAITADVEASSRFDMAAFKAVLHKPVNSEKLDEVLASL